MPDGVDVEQLQARSVQPLFYDPGKPLEYFIAHVVIFFTLSPQAFAVQRYGANLIDRPRIESPPERFQQPRPP